MFTTATHLDDKDNGTFKLLQPLVYFTSIRGLPSHKIEVPTGFVTDFYSVPRPFQGLVARMQRSSGPAIVHDYLFATAGEDGKWTLGECNAILAEAMRVKGVSWWNRVKIMTGIRLGSWLPWRKCVEAWEKNKPKPMTNPENVGKGVQE